MNKKLEKIKADMNNGRLSLDNLSWLVQEVERLSEVEQAYEALKKAM